jgi:hypothetical protein
MSKNYPFLKKQILVAAFIMGFLLCSSRLIAQVDSTFEQMQQSMMEEFNDFVLQNQEEMDEYLDEIDREFSEYLRQSWEEFNLYAGIKPDTSPKPVALPKFDPAVNRMKPGEVPKEIPVQTGSGKPPAVFLPVPNIPVALRSEPADLPPPKPNFLDFYGAGVDIAYDPKMSGTLPDEIHNTTIADFWDRLNKTNFTGVIRQLSDLKTRMNLNDWGYYLLVKKTSEKINPSQNYSRLLTWFLLTKSGYRIRVAYAEDQIALMFPSANIIYGLKYFVIDNVKFYAPDFPFNQIYTYEKDFPGATRIFDLNLYKALNIGNQSAERAFNLRFRDTKCDFSIRYNVNSINFFKDFPLCELKVYFDAALTPGAKESILESLRPQLSGRPATWSVDFLLNFVQNGFPYKTDPEQFNGEEKFFFPEENFFYPFSDCDDRAVLFAYLVKELLNLKVVGVAYPGHVATAIHFPNDEPGDFVMYKGEKYVIADPTYINAPFGLTMPGMANAKAEIIEMANDQALDEQIAAVWEKAATGGGCKGDNQQNLCIDQKGNFYLTGYFSGKATFGGNILTAVNDKKDAFLAGYNHAGYPLWASQGVSEGNDMAYNITIGPSGDLFVSGTFEKSIAFGQKMVWSKGKTAVFIARFDTDGKVAWLRKADLDTLTVSDYIFTTSFDADGEHRTTTTFPVDPAFNDFGLSFDAEGNLYYTAVYRSNAGMRTDLLSLNRSVNFNMAATLKKEADKQLQSNCEQTISGLFGAIGLIRINNVVISGKTVQEAFEKYNPGFKTAAPKVFESLGKIRMVRNDDGIIRILTEDGKPVVLYKIKISNDARLKVSLLENGDARMDILSGVTVGKAFIWFNLNHVRMFRSNGNLIFDYDTDHSQVTMNMKKDLLF